MQEHAGACRCMQEHAGAAPTTCNASLLGRLAPLRARSEHALRIARLRPHRLLSGQPAATLLPRAPLRTRAPPAAATTLCGRLWRVERRDGSRHRNVARAPTKRVVHRDLAAETAAETAQARVEAVAEDAVALVAKLLDAVEGLDPLLKKASVT